MNKTISRTQVKLYQHSPYLQIKHCSEKATKNFSEAKELAGKQIALIDTNPVLTEEITSLNCLMNKKRFTRLYFLR